MTNPLVCEVGEYERRWASCDCPLTPHHRWNCTLTPIWHAYAIEVGANPWPPQNPNWITNAWESA